MDVCMMHARSWFLNYFSTKEAYYFVRRFAVHRDVSVVRAGHSVRGMSGGAGGRGVVAVMIKDKTIFDRKCRLMLSLSLGFDAH